METNETDENLGKADGCAEVTQIWLVNALRTICPLADFRRQQNAVGPLLAFAAVVDSRHSSLLHPYGAQNGKPPAQCARPRAAFASNATASNSLYVRLGTRHPR